MALSLHDIQEIIRRKNWLSGQFIGASSTARIIIIAEKPSLNFKKNPEKRSRGNFNSDSRADKLFGKYVSKFLKGAYVTDMVKKEGLPGADFVAEWNEESQYKRILTAELRATNPKVVGLMSRKVEKLFNKEFPEYRERSIYISQPAYIVRYNKRTRWDRQFTQLRKLAGSL